MSEILAVGYCHGVNASGLACFVRDHCLRHTHPSATERVIDAPFRWWLADQATWAMECGDYVEDTIARARFAEHTTDSARR